MFWDLGTLKTSSLKSLQGAVVDAVVRGLLVKIDLAAHEVDFSIHGLVSLSVIATTLDLNVVEDDQGDDARTLSFLTPLQRRKFKAAVFDAIDHSPSSVLCAEIGDGEENFEKGEANEESEPSVYSYRAAWNEVSDPQRDLTKQRSSVDFLDKWEVNPDQLEVR